MSRLANPGVGDILDRLSILTLKILQGEDLGRDTSHFRKEAEVLATMIALRKIPTESVIALTAVNARLWEAEDRMRAFRSQDVTTVDAVDVMEWAFRIQGLNDRRNQVIQAINKDAGDHLGDEKLR